MAENFQPRLYMDAVRAAQALKKAATFTTDTVLQKTKTSVKDLF